METVCVMHVFIDGGVVVNGKYIYYGMHIFFYVLLKHKHNNINNINDYNNFKKIQIVHRKAIINENKKIFQANCVDIYI